MDSAELRTAQQPLKDAYRADPQAALVTLRASAVTPGTLASSLLGAKHKARARSG
jgi:hypothetical protein